MSNETVPSTSALAVRGPSLGDALLHFLEHLECDAQPPSPAVQAPKVPSIQCEVSTKTPSLDVKVLGPRFSSHLSHCLVFAADVILLRSSQIPLALLCVSPLHLASHSNASLLVDVKFSAKRALLHRELLIVVPPLLTVHCRGCLRTACVAGCG